MAISDAYFTFGEYQATDRGRIDSSRQADVEADALAIARYLEARSGRYFNKDDTATIRIYDPRVDSYDPDRCGYNRALMVQDIASTVGLTLEVDSALDGTYATAFNAGQYELRPLNAAVGPEAWPYTEIYLHGWSSAPRSSWYASERIRVTAIHGWPAVPTPVKRAAIRLCEILRLDGIRGTREMNDVGVVLGASSEARGIVADLIHRYAKGTAIVGIA